VAKHIKITLDCGAIKRSVTFEDETKLATIGNNIFNSIPNPITIIYKVASSTTNSNTSTPIGKLNMQLPPNSVKSVNTS
jgi:hypothetical protein